LPKVRRGDFDVEKSFSRISESPQKQVVAFENSNQKDFSTKSQHLTLGKASALRRVIVEVGAGTGLFSVELARRHPENFYVAVDIKSDRLYTGAKLADELGLENVVFVRGDIWRLGEMFASGSVAEIWVTFPDPYASEDQTRLKKSDAKHRLTHPRFLEIYKQLLQQGRLHFKTDNQPLFEWSREQLEQNGWKITVQANDLHGSDLSEDYKIKTSYEARFTEQGLPIFYLTATILP
jgi:tRNA (guanine-N7-)-methyltransferase